MLAILARMKKVIAAVLLIAALALAGGLWLAQRETGAAPLGAPSAVSTTASHPEATPESAILRHSKDARRPPSRGSHALDLHP